MCGITGVISKDSPCDDTIRGMANKISSRGPDSCGTWSERTIGLGHRRLAVRDLTQAGHQPMNSPCDRYVLVYNGEIYNHLELRAELEKERGGFNWNGQSDTETLLAALRHWGIQGALERVNGMFAFALWDRYEETLFLGRDRMGEKPLYYGWNGGNFLFGSELKALSAHPAWKGEVDRNALALYLRHNYIPGPWSIYQGIWKLPPAHYVIVRRKGEEIRGPICYWDLARSAEHGVNHSVDGPEKYQDELDSLLRDSVFRRMAADVPLGAFLSGGYDSTIVAAMMQAQSQRPIKTFSIGFHEQGYNEAQHAKAVSEYIGSEHTELYVTPEEAREVIPKIPKIYDEPFSDSSQIPTFLVSDLAKKDVTVSLSGDGGDELFYGYDRYFVADRLWSKLSKVPLSLRRLAAWIASNAPAFALERAMAVLPKRLRINHFADRLPKLAEILNHPTGESFYRVLVSHWKRPDQVVLGGKEPETLLNQRFQFPELPSLREQMMYFDQMTYLPGDNLVKIDRASMAVSLEVRVPLLDHRVVEFAWRVPTEFKYREGKGKWLLRQVLYRYVPQDLMDRPKMGFGVPIEHWLRGALREWAEELLDEKRLREEGFFDPAPIRRMWQEHVSGKRRWHYYLWD